MNVTLTEQKDQKGLDITAVQQEAENLERLILKLPQSCFLEVVDVLQQLINTAAQHITDGSVEVVELIPLGGTTDSLWAAVLDKHLPQALPHQPVSEIGGATYTGDQGNNICEEDQSCEEKYLQEDIVQLISADHPSIHTAYENNTDEGNHEDDLDVCLEKTKKSSSPNGEKGQIKLKEEWKRKWAGEIECPLCENSSVHYKMNALEQHWKENHLQMSGSGGFVWECPLCKTNIPLKVKRKSPLFMSRVVQHWSKKHSRTIPASFPVISCSMCEFRTYILVGFHSHACNRTKNISTIETGAPTKDLRAPPVPCEICGKMIKVKSIKTHMASFHEMNREKLHSCSDCNEKFYTIGSLNVHKSRRHSKQPEFLCSACSQQFVTKIDLQLHMFSSHDVNIDGKQVWSCDQCSYRSLLHSRYVRHVETHNKEKGHVCHHCGCSFNMKEKLMSHLKRHSSEKVHQCSICSFSTTTRQYLARHMRHHGSKGYHCPFCEHSSIISWNLKKHVTSVHKDIPEVMNGTWRCPKKGDKLDATQQQHNSILGQPISDQIAHSTL